MLHYIVCADVGALYFMRLDIWLFKITDDPSLALFTSGCCLLNVRDELRLRCWKQCSVLSALWALEPGEGVNIALGTWPPVDSGLVVVAAKY